MRSARSFPWLLIVLGFTLATFAVAEAAPKAVGGLPSASRAPWIADTEECRFLGLINQYRKENGLSTLTISLTLSASAEFHSLNMATLGYFSHTLLDGTTWAQNIANFGYPSDTSRAENIAAGRATAEEVFQQWKGSPSHNANMLGAKFNAIGIGRAPGLPISPYKWYWTTTFGSKVDVPYTCPNGTGNTTDNPGALLVISGGGRTSTSTASTFAYDGDPSTSWYTLSTTPPRSAYVYVDLGSAKTIGQLQWLFSKNGSADSFKIQISSDKLTWSTLTTRTTAKAGTWQTLKVGKKARYVRFSFDNPNKDAVLGYLAEIKLYA
jgi:uncharacterized protein YkwD